MNALATRILIIDDELALRRFLDTSLGNAGFQISKVKSGKEGLLRAQDFRPDLIILDLNLPDMSGLDLLLELRRYSTVPVIVLTAKNADQDKVLLLNAGADDYLTKPFSIPELMARIRVALRHAHHQKANEPFVLRDLEIDFVTRVVKVAQQPVKLTQTEYQILKLLAVHAWKLITQKQLLQEIWGPAAIEQTHYLRIYIGQLRKKLEILPTLKGLILTEPGVGYRLNIDS